MAGEAAQAASSARMEESVRSPFPLVKADGGCIGVARPVWLARADEVIE